MLYLFGCQETTLSAVQNHVSAEIQERQAEDIVENAEIKLRATGAPLVCRDTLQTNAKRRTLAALPEWRNPEKRLSVRIVKFAVLQKLNATMKITTSHLKSTGFAQATTVIITAAL